MDISAYDRKIKRITIKIKDQKKLHAAYVTEFSKWISRNFEQEGRLAGRGKKWTKLKPSTVEAKRRKGKSKMLHITGDMKKKWEHTATSKIAKIKSRQNYAKNHHLGIGVPQRRLLPDDQQKKEIILKVAEYFYNNAKR